MFLYKMYIGNEIDAKRFVAEANKNVKSLKDERFDEQYDVAFCYDGAYVLVEYDTYQSILEDFIEKVCKDLGITKTNLEYVDSYEFHKFQTVY